MSKLILLLLLVEEFPSKIRDPFLPFIAPLELFETVPDLFRFTLLTVFFASSAMLLLNLAPRTGCIGLGVVIILQLLACKPMFRNHVFICGCVLFLAGLHRRGERPWLVHWQISLIYFGAFVNKLLDPDWLSGQFMHHWLLTARGNPFYAAVYETFPPFVLAKFLSWCAMASEILMCIGFLLPSTQRLAVYLGLLFHGGLYIALRGEHFGYFLQAVAISYISFLNWPRGSIHVEAKGPLHRPLAMILSSLNWDRQIRSVQRHTSGGPWLRTSFESEDISTVNVRALSDAVSYCAAFYVLLFTTYHVSLLLIGPPWGFVFVCCIAAVLVAFFILPDLCMSLRQRTAKLLTVRSPT